MITWLTKCIGIELCSLGEGEFTARSCTLSLQKNTVTIIGNHVQSGTLKNVLNKIDKSLPLAITLSGRDILIRFTNSVYHNAQDCFSSVFPGLKSDDFYIMPFVSGKFNSVSIVRRELIDNLIEQIKVIGLQPSIISIGPFVLSHVVQQLNTYDGSVVIAGHQINYEQKTGDWINYQFTAGLSSEFPLKIGVTPIEENMVMAYASAFQLLLYPRLCVVSLDVEAVKTILSELEQKFRFIGRLSWVAGIVFILLLVNFFALEKLSEKNAQLQAWQQRREKNIDNVAEVRKVVEKNEELLNKMAVRKGYRKAVMIDQIRSTVPAAIKFEYLGINSGSKEERPNTKEDIRAGIIEIIASTKVPASVNVWISALRGISWVKSARISDFSPGEDDDYQCFTILINY